MSENNIYLYNTLTKKKEIFKPINPNLIKIYSCGPTVYSRAHIGNLKSYIMVDVLVKILKYNGYKLEHVMNITDVGHLVSDGDTGEDKVAKAAKKEKLTPEEISRKYENMFFEDIKLLNINIPNIVVRATDEISEMEEYVKELVDKGFAYETTNTIYFDTSKLDKYGILSKVNLDNNIEGVRVDVDAEKRNKEDFALWIKAPENHIMKWDSFFGKSYPGWHIECSAISKKYLGVKFDIHTGGVDHICFHHENEIAQSKGLTGEIPANYWIHSGHLVVNNTKMSKSLGNVYSIDDLINKGFSALDFRYFTYLTSYGHKINFTFTALESAQNALNNLKKLYLKHLNANEQSYSEEIKNKIDKNILKWENDFLTSINDNLNMAKAVAVVFEALKYQNKSKKIGKLISKFDLVLSLGLNENDIKLFKGNEEDEGRENKDEKDVKEDKNYILAMQLKNKRDKLREEKEFNLADELRDKIYALGYTILDTAEGSILKEIE